MSSNRKPAFRWVGMEGVYEALDRIKTFLKSRKPSDSNFREQVGSKMLAS